MRCFLSSKTAATILSLAALLAAAGSAGCASSKKVQHERAMAQWSGARASVLAGLARDQYNTGNFDKCRVTLDEALKLNPKDPQLHILSAKLAMEQGQLEAAAQGF